MPAVLPPLPPHVNFLSDEDNDRLESLFNLPTSSAHCETCGGSKTFRFYDSMSKDEAQRQVIDYDCACQDQFLLQRWLLNAGVGKHFAQLWWGDAGAVDLKTQQVALEYAANADNYIAAGYGLFLHGEHGNGKSLISVLLLKRLLSRGIDGQWVTLNELLSNYQETWRGTKEDRAWFDKRVRNARVLVVDDMGREFEGRSTATSSVDTIFRTRVQNGLTTIVTTNLTREEFAQRYTKGVLSLVTEACLDHEVVGSDWRFPLSERKRFEALAGIRRPFTFG